MPAELARHPGQDRLGVTDAVEEVGIAEGDVPRAGRHLGADVAEHDVNRDDPEAAVVDRHDRTVPAAVLAAAARFRVAGRAPLPGGLQGGIAGQRRQPAAIRHQKGESRQLRPARPVEPGIGRRRRAAAGDPDQIVLELAAEDVRHAALAEQRGVERRVQAVGRERRAGVERAHPIDDRQRQPRRRVHGQEERDQRRAAHRRLVQAVLARDRHRRRRAPAAFNHAAGDASPNGWRPMS